MRTKITDFIPTTAPHLLYEKDVPTAGPDDVFDPIIAGDLVLVSLDPYEFVSDRFIRLLLGRNLRPSTKTAVNGLSSTLAGLFSGGNPRPSFHPLGIRVNHTRTRRRSYKRSICAREPSDSR